MKTFIIATMIVVAILAGGTIYKEDITSADQIPTLKEEVQHQTVSQRISACFTRYHYRKFDLNVEFASKIFDRYLNMLDHNHNVLLASDITQFATQKSRLANELKSGKLDLLYEMYNLSKKRCFERYQYALAQLIKPMDFNGNDSIEIDRSKTPWPMAKATLDKLWYNKVKYDRLNLKITGKDDKEIRNILTKRYQLAIQRLTQSNSEDVFQMIMNAFANEIDPHTNYLSPRNTEKFNTKMSLLLEGIGAVLQMNDDYIVINSLVPGGPAENSKAINVSDRVVGVGQTGKQIVDIIGWRLDDVLSLIKGPKGSKVYLKILPPGENTKTRIVPVSRQRIRLKDRVVKMFVKTIGKEKVAVLDIPSFYIGLTDDVKVQLQNLEKQKVQSVIIDLRANGGGLLTEAVSLSGLFIPSGPIVQVLDNKGKIRKYSNINNIVYYKGSLVVLVDRLSASASEIFAAAMQDYGRALLVGEPTFGKGTIQQYRSLNRIYDRMVHPGWPAFGSIQYTIKKFYRVNGGSTQLKGVLPDFIMPIGIKAVEIGEKFKNNALSWDSISPTNYNKVGDLKPFATELLRAHQLRIAKDPEFQYIQQDIARFYATKDKHNWISLNLSLREQENHENYAIRLQRTNERLVNQCKKPIKNLESIPPNYKDPDPYLDETVQIALNLAHAETSVIS